MAKLDLTQKRLERQRARLAAAQHEGGEETLTIAAGDEVIAELPAEFPVEVLRPLLGISEDVMMLAYQLAKLQSGEEGAQATLQTALGLVAGNASLPQEVVGAVTEVGRLLFGDAAFAKLVALRLSREDIAAIVSELIRHYGVMPGESSPSASSSETAGQTSKTTSTTAESTPEPSGTGPVVPGGLASAAS